MTASQDVADRPMRIGQIVPSSNTTMEREIPKLLAAHSAAYGSSFTFHSARMRMKQVTPEELAAMNAQMYHGAVELGDAQVDVVALACLVAIMSQEPGFHLEAEQEVSAALAAEGAPCPVLSSAGALVDVVHGLGARRIAILAPYMCPLTDRVVSYLQHSGLEVTASRSLEIPDNLEVGRRDPMLALEEVRRLDTSGADLVVLSACVQMPSLEAIARAEDELGLPVVSAATCTARRVLEALELPVEIPGFGAALRSEPVLTGAR